ncbi:hypothetical protein [Devosia soli]|uniref:hypothetical protein n=1 Tax=Devosia soli TaxID=361041 RepID=UPI000A6E5B99|nr:hypothetical protein [Devosia soli]
MFGWLNLTKHMDRRRQRIEAEQLRRLERAELQAGINALDHRRNNIEHLMRRMLEERNA